MFTKGSKEGGDQTEMPEFRFTGGQTGRMVGKAGMESGRKGKGELGRKWELMKKMKILPKV